MSATLQEALARLAVNLVGFELMLLDINDLFAICTISWYDIFRPLPCRDLTDLVCEQSQTRRRDIPDERTYSYTPLEYVHAASRANQYAKGVSGSKHTVSPM